MGAPCSICTRPDRAAIDDAIVSGGTNRGVARRFDLGRDSVGRHRQNHVSSALARVVQHREEAGPTSALDRMEELYAEARELLASAREEGKASLQLGAIRELRGIVETLAKITGELDERPTVQVLNVATSPEHIRMRTVLMEALAPFPEATQAVARRLALEAGS